MLNLKISLMLVASSAIALIATTAAHAEQYPQFVEIVKQSQQLSPCQCVTTRDSLNQLNSDAAILNDDKIGDKAIAKFGCDCSAHRRSIAQILINQIN